jgi:single-strand DNA-binding protein
MAASFDWVTAPDFSKPASSKLAEICASYCVKGRRVYIEGRLRTREYDGTDGLRRHSTEIVAETMKLLDRPQADNAARGKGDDAAGGGGDDAAGGGGDDAPGGGGAPGAGDNAGDHDESAESD